MRQQLGEHAPQGRPGDLARREGGRTGFELGGEASRHDLAPRRLFLGREPGRAPAQRRPGRRQRRFARRIVLQRAHVVHEVVAGGAVARPVARQGLAAQQDLFDHQPGPLAQPPAQRPAIACRIGEAVDMVDAQAVDQALGMKAERQGVHGFEDFRLLHAQADQLVDVEEAPPVDAVAGAAPPGEAIVLAFQHVAERTRAAGRQRQAMGEVAQRLLPHRDLARRQRLLPAACPGSAAGPCRRPSSRCRRSGHTGWRGRGAARRPTRRWRCRPPCDWARCRRSGRGPRRRAWPPASATPPRRPARD